MRALEKTTTRTWLGGRTAPAAGIVRSRLGPQRFYPRIFMGACAEPPRWLTRHARAGRLTRPAFPEAMNGGGSLS